jgi:hypothetical protein
MGSSSGLAFVYGFGDSLRILIFGGLAGASLSPRRRQGFQAALIYFCQPFSDYENRSNMG